MSHIRRPLAAALALNTVTFVVEGVAGFRANSMSLLMDAAHNMSDELALACLFLAYVLSTRMSRGLQRSANLFNSFGLILICAVILAQAAERLLHPRPVVGWLPAVAGLLAAIANGGVALALRPWIIRNPTIRLAYIHNLGDVYVSLLPALAGVLITLTGRPIFDPLLAGVVALWIMYSTVQEVRQSGDALLWPEEAMCPHESTATARPQL